MSLSDKVKGFTNDVKLFQLYELHGHGVMESRYYEGETIKFIECTELEAWITVEAINIERYGYLHTRSSWEEPTAHYREVKPENKNDEAVTLQGV